MKNWQILVATLITFSVATERPVGVNPKKTHVSCFSGRVPKFRVENFFFFGGGEGQSLALINFGTMHTNPERCGPRDDWEARVTSETFRVSEGPSSVRARAPPGTDMCALSMVERNMS
jgi:hypothetical protein